MSDVIITVRGESEARTVPERGTAHVTVSVDGPDRRAVIARAGEIAAPVRDVLSALHAAGGLEQWSSQRVSVWADRPWNQDGRMLDLVHHASVEITATFTDFAALSDWTAELAEVDGVQVGTVDWTLTPATRARLEREVAVAAVASAAERASAYAQALGRSTVVPLEVADLGLLAPGDRSSSPRLMAKAAMDMEMASSPVDFRPDEIVVSAAVEARFRAE